MDQPILFLLLKIWLNFMPTHQLIGILGIRPNEDIAEKKKKKNP